MLHAEREGCANSGVILIQADREGFDRAHSAADCFGKPVIQGNAGGAPLRRLFGAGTTHQFGEAARQSHDACSFEILFDPGEAFQDLLEEEAADLCGERHQRHEDRRGRRWGKAMSPMAFFMAAGSTSNCRGFGRRMVSRNWKLPSLAAGQREGWLGLVGDEPDADQRLDPPVPALGSPA